MALLAALRDEAREEQLSEEKLQITTSESLDLTPTAQDEICTHTDQIKDLYAEKFMVHEAPLTPEVQVTQTGTDAITEAIIPHEKGTSIRTTKKSKEFDNPATRLPPPKPPDRVSVSFPSPPMPKPLDPSFEQAEPTMPPPPLVPPDENISQAVEMACPDEPPSYSTRKGCCVMVATRVGGEQVPPPPKPPDPDAKIEEEGSLATEVASSVGLLRPMTEMIGSRDWPPLEPSFAAEMLGGQAAKTRGRGIWILPSKLDAAIADGKSPYGLGVLSLLAAAEEAHGGRKVEARVVWALQHFGLTFDLIGQAQTD